MAKSPRAKRRLPSAALRTTALRAGFGLAVVGLAAGLYAWRGSPAKLAVEVPEPPTRPVVAAVADPPPAAAPSRATPAPAASRVATLETVKPMSAALRTAFDAWLMATYARCWRAPKTLPDGEPYLAKVRVAFREDGELASPPKLVNPPSDPAWRPHAEAALKAVKGCDPLHVPDKYADYYPSWKSRTVYFDPTRN